jgi:hypothetical protein
MAAQKADHMLGLLNQRASAESHRKDSLEGQSVSTSSDLAAEFGFIGQDIAPSCSQEPHKGGVWILSVLSVAAFCASC